MNRFFKSIWSDALGVWVATSELSAARGKRSSTSLKAVAVAVALMFGASSGAMAGITLGEAIAANALDVGLGDGAVANSGTGKAHAIAIGDGAAARAEEAVSIGSAISNKAAYSVVMGHGGVNVDAASLGSVVLSPTGGTVTNSTNSFTFGKGATTDSAGAINLGGVVTTAAGGVAIGSGTAVTAANSVALGAGSVADRTNTVAVGGRQIAMVKAGTDDKDAVNVAQLKDVTKGLGGGAAVNPDGTVTQPGYTVGGTNVNNVGDAITEINKGLDNAVKYDDAGKGSVSLKGGANGTQIHNVAAGTVDLDAVNLKQLKELGLKINTSGVATNAFVAYDDKTTKDSVTLEGTSGTQIHNVNAGTVDKDAVNLKQLKDAGLVVGPSGEVKNAFVAYDTAAKDKVSLGGTGAHEVTLTNVKAGAADLDAVNLKQLKDAGLTVGPSGEVKNAFVAYDTAAKDKVSLGGTGAHEVTLTNVKAGAADLDAVNLKQLKDAGLTIGPSGEVKNAFVAYDTAAKDKVSLGGTGAHEVTLTNVKAGAADLDAVNLKQLKDAGLTIGPSGEVKNAFVAYDTAAKDKVSLGGTGAHEVTLTNVKAGAADLDAVNLKQLKDAGLTIGPSGEVKNAFVAYDTAAKDKVSLGGTGAHEVTLTNVKAGAADLDAVNLKQLKDAGLTIGPSGEVKNAFVAYDTAAKDKVTLGGGAAGTTITNVKDGQLSSVSTDAVNGRQLFAVKQQTDQNTTDITNINNTINNINSSVGLVVQDQTSRDITIGAKTDGSVINVAGTAGARTVTGVAAGEVSATSTQAINGSQLHNTASTIATALGGGAGVDANGGVTAPTYHVGGVDTHDVGSALSNIDGRVTQNTTDIAAVTAASKNAVQYDSDAHDKVTLGGKDAAGKDGVQLTNVKAGELSATSTDAVNGAQLNATNERIDQYTNVVNNLQNGNEYLAINTSKGSTLPTATGKDAVALGTNAKATGDNAVALGANSVADQPNTVSVGSAGNERRITNVAPGQAGTDAVNMNQLNSVSNTVAANQRAAFGGVASAMAMPNLTPREAGNTVVAVGIGSYKGYSAVGVSGTYRSRDGAWLINGGLSSTGHGDTGVRAQVGYEF